MKSKQTKFSLVRIWHKFPNHKDIIFSNCYFCLFRTSAD